MELKALPGGGWTTDGRAYYRVKKSGEHPHLNEEKVSWGKKHSSLLNEWATVDALSVLLEAHRVNL